MPRERALTYGLINSVLNPLRCVTVAERRRAHAQIIEGRAQAEGPVLQYTSSVQNRDIMQNVRVQAHSSSAADPGWGWVSSMVLAAVVCCVYILSARHEPLPCSRPMAWRCSGRPPGSPQAR